MDSEYKSYIKSLAAQCKNVVFYNSDAQHAAVVIGTMFETSKKTVKLYSGSLSGDISKQKDYIDGLEQFLNNGGKLQVLLQKGKFDENNEPELFNNFRLHNLLNKDQVVVKTHGSHVNRGEDKHEIHFLVGDNKMYRIEDDIVKFSAVCNFNDTDMATTLSNTFDTVFSSDDAKEYKL